MTVDGSVGTGRGRLDQRAVATRQDRGLAPFPVPRCFGAAPVPGTNLLGIRRTLARLGGSCLAPTQGRKMRLDS